MTRFTVPKTHVPPQREAEPDELPLPVDPDRGPTPDLLPDDPNGDGVTQPVGKKESHHATA